MKFVMKHRLLTFFAAIGLLLLCKEIYVYASTSSYAGGDNLQAVERLNLSPVVPVTVLLKPPVAVHTIPESVRQTVSAPEARYLVAKASENQDVFSKKMDGLDFLFDSTIRNCLGAKCFDERPGRSAVDRVGLLGTDSSGIDHINNCLFELLGVKYVDTDGINTVTTSKDVQKSVPRIIQSSHVPAYGYGKNHGWNRIIRVVRRPAYHAVDLLRKHRVLSGHVSANEDAVSAQTRLLVRWQCRLSHVAAHTKMLTVYIEDVVSRPAVEIEKIMTFAGVSLPERPVFLDITARLADVLKESLRLETGQLWDDSVSVANDYKRYLGVAAAVLEEEMTGTKRLSDWPCRSFRKVESGEQLPFAADYFAPNCTAPFVTCSVGVDKKGA